MRNMEGFSIVELMVVVILAAIILGLGAPSFADFQRNNRLSGAANDLLGVIQTARGEAIKRQSPVSICPAMNPASDAALCDGASFLAYISFNDLNGDCIRQVNEVLLRVSANSQTAPGTPLKAVSDGKCISFAATGFLQPLPDTAKETLFCDNRGMKVDGSSSAAGAPTLLYARGVGISTTGRARVTRDKDEIVLWAPKVICP
jgi:type IV fimbrial biogenesis protein FimT